MNKQTDDPTSKVSGRATVSGDGYPICPKCGKKSAASVEQLKYANKQGGGNPNIVRVACPGCGQFFELYLS